MKKKEISPELKRDVDLALRQYAEDGQEPPPIEELIERFERQDNS